MNIKESTQKVWSASPAGTTYAEGAAPGTQRFFETVLQRRSLEEMPWLFALVPFDRFGGRHVLEIGCGAGFDAYTFCRAGAIYTGIDLTPANAARTRAHLGFYGFSPQVLVGDAECLMFADEQFDVVFANGVLHHTPDMAQSCREIGRVLKHGGEFWVIVYHKHSLFHWVTLWLVEHLARGGFRRRTFAQRMAQIEYTTSDATPLVNVYSRRELVRVLQRAGLRVEATWVRKLVRADLPNIPVLRRLYPYLPQPWLDRAGQLVGWYLIARVRKP